MTVVRKQRSYGALFTIAVSGVLAGIALRIGPAWGHGIIGDGDAWQNLWNIEHVRRWLLGSGELYATKMLWAPEGVGLGAHTLALSFSLPAALASFLVGSPLAHNLAVLASFVLCAWASYRLVVVRTPWDYFARLEEFLHWARTTSALTDFVNPFPVIEWNSHKAYLRELAAAGIATVPTLWLARGASDSAM